ncbi:putative Zn-binding protein involved in type VI secretion [Pseudomonas graminis]|uniref:PAAR domain-containing protein n=1 Tax=Pseudomonas graminis TaxID=158627 RepID=UPI0010603C04|nr:PAAR domain-containing protein [Pseudomonas graminis]TDV51431.1 putative Zn-binding protein involved in type VI secretion [Pseudomonas graminis]
MTYVVREGDSTTTGGMVLSATGSHTWEDRRLARMGDPVWCERCAQIGFIAQGNPTFIDELVAVATHGQAVRCGCEEGTHRLIASQTELEADMDATIDIPKDMAEKARKRAKHMTRARRESHAPLA